MTIETYWILEVENEIYAMTLDSVEEYTQTEFTFLPPSEPGTGYYHIQITELTEGGRSRHVTIPFTVSAIPEPVMEAGDVGRLPYDSGTTSHLWPSPDTTTSSAKAVQRCPPAFQWRRQPPWSRPKNSILASHSPLSECPLSL